MDEYLGMDNRSLKVTSRGNEGIGLALRLVWPNAAGGKATHYREVRVKQNKPGEYPSHVEAGDGTTTLVLFWNEGPDSKELPFPLTCEDATDFVQRWLAQVVYSSEPDHDGDNVKGWHMFTDHWGHVLESHYGIIGVQPAWAMLGK